MSDVIDMVTKVEKRLGRPAIFDDQKKTIFCELLANGNTIGSICEGMQMSTSTFRSAKRNDPNFASMVDMAMRVRTTLVEDALYMTALQGNVTAQKFYLINRSPGRWADTTKVDVNSGSSGFEPMEMEEDDLDRQISLLKEQVNSTNQLLDSDGNTIADV